MKKIFIITSLLAISNAVKSQSALENYIKIALENNLTLKNSKLEYVKSEFQKKEAFGYFLPSLNFEARYSKADGGRYFDVPIGDLLNPIYSLLNLSLIERGLSPMFPTDLKNQRLYLFRKKEREEKLRFIQPIFNFKIYYNYKARSWLSMAKYAEYSRAANEIIFETKKAYYNCLKAEKALRAYKVAHKTISEYYKVVKKLYENDKSNYGTVKAAEAELLDIEAKILEYDKNVKAARAYFNLVLKRDLENEIVFEEDSTFIIEEPQNADYYSQLAFSNRYEFKIIEYSKEAFKNYKSTIFSELFPSASFVFDYGYQGEKYRWTKDDRYWMMSFVVQWNLFKGFQDKNKMQEADIEIKQIENSLEETRLKIALQIKVLIDEYKAETAKFKAYNKKYQAAKIYLEYASKKYELGVSSQMEYLDAQNKKIVAETEMINSYYDALIKKAELEKALGTEPQKFIAEKIGADNE